MKTVEKIECNTCHVPKEKWEYYLDKKTSNPKYKFCRDCFTKKQNQARQQKRNEYAYF